MTIEVLADAVTKLNETTKNWDRLREEVGEDNIYVKRMGETLRELTDILEQEFHEIILNEVMADNELQ